MHGLGYNGAGSMAGRLSYCSAVIKETYPRAIKLTPATNMWAVLLEAALFFKYSPKRQAKLESVIKASDEHAHGTK